MIDTYTQGDNKAVNVNSDWVRHIHSLFLYSLGTPSSGFVAMFVAIALARELGGTLDVYVATPTAAAAALAYTTIPAPTPVPTPLTQPPPSPYPLPSPTAANFD